MGAESFDNVRPFPTNYQDDFIPLIEPGVYSMTLEHWQTAVFFGRSQKVVMWFRVLEMGQAFGKVIPRYYNVKRLTTKPKRNGGFAAGRSSDLVREYCLIHNKRPTRLDRVSLCHYQGVIVKGRVDTVSRDSRQSALPEAARYSVVKELVGLEQ